MKICLCCGKSFKDSASETERDVYEWHQNCISKFFGIRILPDINISDEMLKKLATESINKGYTVPGVQKKISLHLTIEKEPRLTLVNYPTGYILKPQTKEYTSLPEAEYLIMQMAKATGIRTVPFALIKMRSQKDSLAYITKRIDRIKSDEKSMDIYSLAMEDFCQLEGRLTLDKYRGSYERCSKVIEQYSSQNMLDQTELFLRVVFSFVVGNSDMHLKNFSLIEDGYCSGSYVLSDAYDMLPVNVILPEDKEQFALTINGKKRNIRKKDFLVFAESMGLPMKSGEKIIKKVVSMEKDYIIMCTKSFLSDEMKENLIKLINERISIIR